MRRFHSITPFPVGAVAQWMTHVLGVVFLWYQDEPLPSDPALLERDREFERAFREGVGDALRRQRRTRPEFWDGLTYFERAGIPSHVLRLREGEIAAALIKALSTGEPHDEAVLALARLPLIECSRARLQLHRKGSIFASRGFTPRVGPSTYMWLECGSDLREGFHRSLEVDMTALEFDPAKLDLAHLLLLAVLVQVYAELEVFYETGLRRLRTCERESCGAWFCSGPMDGRSRFCSTVCRVGHARDSARHPQPPRTRSRPPRSPKRATEKSAR